MTGLLSVSKFPLVVGLPRIFIAIFLFTYSSIAGLIFVSDLRRQSKGQLEKIETAIPLAENFQTSCGRLLEWLDRVEPAIEDTKACGASETEVRPLPPPVTHVTPQSPSLLSL